MKKLLSILFVLCLFCTIPASVFADEVEEVPAVAVTEEEPAINPDQAIENGKGFLGVNYNRQDSNKTGKQRIVNDHSFFNVNINIIKEGALFKTKDAEF